MEGIQREGDAETSAVRVALQQPVLNQARDYFLRGAGLPASHLYEIGTCHGAPFKDVLQGQNPFRPVTSATEFLFAHPASFW